MLMVVLGAGASFGSRPGDGRVHREDAILDSVRRPPLTKALFSAELSAYANKYPASRPVIVLLREEMAANPDRLIEEVIGRFAEEASDDPERARHMLALRFYLCDLILKETQTWWDGLNGFTHYSDLLARLGRWRARTREPVVLVTFNYDELVDRSLEGQTGDLALDSFDSYVKRDDWRLYKLHGSVGWSRALARLNGLPINAGPIQLIPRANEPSPDDGTLIPEPWERAKDRMTDHSVFVPGIAVPTDRKNTFECLPDHLARFVSDVEQVDRVLTIGWRAAEQHVHEIFSERLRPGYHLAICDVSHDDVSSVYANLGTAGKKAGGRYRKFDRGFTGLLSGDELERWLNEPAAGDRG